MDLPEYPWTDYSISPLMWRVCERYRVPIKAHAEGALKALIEELGEPFSFVPSQVLNLVKAEAKYPVRRHQWFSCRCFFVFGGCHDRNR